ncbi:cystatin-A8-like [Aquarana catesbeiana]|uniref:cystatin-A8-like n=1 Tax=Aquarana catesbeiana TaxID=8400 RepID=UPI003CC97D82
MSNLGGSEHQKCGGWTDPRKPDPEDQAILDKVKEQYVEKSGMNPLQFVAVLVRTQVVNGINYLFEVEVGENAYKRLLVYVPLPGQGEPHLVAILPDKTPDDKLEGF